MSSFNLDAFVLFLVQNAGSPFEVSLGVFVFFEVFFPLC